MHGVRASAPMGKRNVWQTAPNSISDRDSNYASSNSDHAYSRN